MVFVVVIVVIVLDVLDVVVVVVAAEIDNWSRAKIGSKYIESFAAKWIIHTIV